MVEIKDPEVRAVLEQATLKIKRLNQELKEIKLRRTEPIAIVGMACRFPGGVEDPEGFWQLLDQGKEAISPMAERWKKSGMALSSDTAPGSHWGALLDNVDRFDAEAFDISPREARILDPQQRLLLEVAWEALERAGLPIDRLTNSQTGVYMGVLYHDYEHIVLNQLQHRDVYAVSGLARTFTAGRLSYVLGLQGPCVTVDTACSASLVSIHLACQSLRQGESNLALAGGVNLLLSPLTMDMMARTQALSPVGRCKTFDADARGYVRGEGCGVLVLKRLSDAQRDGDNILAVVRGSAVNQDGPSQGLTAPNGVAQVALLRRALADAGMTPEQVGYIEAHGTGTPLGDPIEMEALREVFGAPRADNTPLLLGSVKTNIGHLESAAGMAAVMKSVLALQHEVVPRHLHFETLNPMIRMQNTPFKIAAQAQPWPRGSKPRAAGISGFALSGTNAHVIVEEAPAQSAAPASEVAEAAALLPLSARTPAALRDMAQRYAAFLRAGPAASLQDMAYSAGARRMHHRHRLAVVGKSPAEWTQALDAFAHGEKHEQLSSSPEVPNRGSQPVFVFSGQGSQWLGMGRELLATEPAFRDSMQACDAAIAQHGRWSVLEALRAPSLEASRFGQEDIVQPVIFAMQVSLAALWRAWGVVPAAVVGHSMGEVAAAHVAGALTLEAAAKVIVMRSALLRQVSGQGAMLMAELEPQEAEATLQPYDGQLCVAAANGGPSMVISGTPAAAQRLLEQLQAAGRFARLVKVSVASHSPQMQPLVAPLVEGLGDLAPQEPSVQVVSTVTGTFMQGRHDAAYWGKNLRQQVLFGAALQQLWDAGNRLFLEVSPHPVLVHSPQMVLRAVQQAGAPASVAVVGSLRRDQPERASMLHGLGALYTQGAAVPFDKLFAGQTRRAVVLPVYPWQRQVHWVELPSESAVAPAAAVAAPIAPADDARQAALRQVQEALRAGAAADPAALSLYLRHTMADVAGIGVSRVSDASELAALGLDSLMSMELIRRVDQDLQRKIPLAAFAQASTVERLVDLLNRPNGFSGLDSSLVVLQAGQGSGLTWVHPSGGSVLPYVELTRLLATARPVYAMQARGLLPGQAADTSIAAMATHYVQLLRAQQPAGPYRLGGWSLGGVVAFEMALQLQAAGASVTLLVMIDSWLPTQRSWPQGPALASSFLGDMVGLQGGAGKVPDAALFGADPGEQLAHIVAYLKEHKLIAPVVRPEHLRPQYDVFRGGIAALQAYKPGRFVGRIQLLAATRRGPDVPAEALSGWESHATDGVDRMDVAGTHYSLMQKPSVQDLAAAIRAKMTNT